MTGPRDRRFPVTRSKLTHLAGGVLPVALLIVLVFLGFQGQGVRAQSRVVSADDRLQLLSQTQFDLGITARDSGHDPVKAAHLLLHAGLNASEAGNEQLVIDAGHAAQDVISAVEFSFPHDGPVTGATVSPDGKLLCSWSFNARSVHLWSLSDGTHVRSLKLPTGVAWARFHPDKPQLLIAAWHTVAVWPFEGDEPAILATPGSEEGSRTGYGNTGRIRSAAFHPDGKTVVVDAAQKLWRWRPGSAPTISAEPFDSVLMRVEREKLRDPELSSAKQFAQVEGEDVQVWDLETGTNIRTIKCDGRVLQFLLNERRQELAIWTGTPQESQLQLWSLDPDQSKPVFSNDAGPAPGRVVLSPDGTTVAGWGEASRTRGRTKSPIQSQIVDLWSWRERQMLKTLTLKNFVHECHFSPDSKHLATLSAATGEVSVYAVDKPSARRVIHVQPDRGVKSVAFHPSLPQLMVVDHAGSAQFFHIGPSPRLRQIPFKKISTFVSQAFYASEGRRLITWGTENIVRVWDLDGPRPLLRMGDSVGNPPRLTWLKGDRFVSSGSFKPSGSNLVIMSLKASVPVWESPISEELRLVAASTDGSHLVTRVLQKWSFPPQPQDAPSQVRPRVQRFKNPPFELRSIREPEPLKTWPADQVKGPGGRRGFRFLDERRYFVWLKNELRLEEPGRPEPVWKRDFKHWVYDVVPFSDGRRFLVKTDRKYAEGEILVLSLDDDEPLLRVPVEIGLVSARLLPGESGVLVWHRGSDQRFQEKKLSFARLHYFNETRPTVTIDNFQAYDLGHVVFDQDITLIGSSGFTSRQAWLWSAETGKRLHQFHHDDRQQTGLDEHHLMNLQLDPLGRFAVTWGGLGEDFGRGIQPTMTLWSLTDFRPLAEYFVGAGYRDGAGNVPAVREDGTFIRVARKDIWLMSPSGSLAPLRRLKLGNYLPEQCLQHPETGKIYATNHRGELFKWPLRTWTREDFDRELHDVERRTAQTLDQTTGRLRNLTYDEYRSLTLSK